jgi:hypothetical protein
MALNSASPTASTSSISDLVEKAATAKASPHGHPLLCVWLAINIAFASRSIISSIWAYFLVIPK